MILLKVSGEILIPRIMSVQLEGIKKVEPEGHLIDAVKPRLKGLDASATCL